MYLQKTAQDKSKNDGSTSDKIPNSVLSKDIVMPPTSQKCETEKKVNLVNENTVGKSHIEM